MMTTVLRLILPFVFLTPLGILAGEISGTGSMITGPLVNVWGEIYMARTPGAVIKYKGSNPADGIKRLMGKEVDFSGIDMPLKVNFLQKNNLVQVPLALGGIAPVINLPNVSRGQFKLDGNTLAEIFLGNIKKWNDPALVALNPALVLPDAGIIVIHRTSPEGISTVIGNYLAKIHPQWKALKGDGMAGTWPAQSIEVKDPIEYASKMSKTVYSIGYLPVPQVMKNGLVYAQLKTKSGTFLSPSDENISAAAENAIWSEADGFDVVLTNQPGATSWPLSFASFLLMHKTSDNPERTRELLKYLKYSLRYGGLKAVQYDYIPLPDVVRAVITSSFSKITDSHGVAILKN